MNVIRLIRRIVSCNCLSHTAALLLITSLPFQTHAALIGISQIVVTSNAESGSNVLQIAEVIASSAEDGTDLALASNGVTVTASSVWNNIVRELHAPKHAIDGDNTPGQDSLLNYYHSHTDPGQSYRLNFSSPVNLDALTLIGRADCCSGRDIYDITLLDQNGAELGRFNRLDANNASHRVTQTFASVTPPSNALVREILIESDASSSSEILQIAEVIATDSSTAIDVATQDSGATVTAASIYAAGDRFAASLAIDGVSGPGTSGNYYHSSTAANQYLRVRLAANTSLSQVAIVGRSSCCSARDVYAVTLLDDTGNVLFQQSGLNANNAQHMAIWDVPADPDQPPPAPPMANENGRWGEVMDWPLVAVSMANLPDGRILTYSGSERRTWPSTEQTYSATWDPLSNTFDETLHLGHNMFCAAMSMTSDGQVFVNGGRNSGNSPWTSLYDYETSQWSQIENMASGGRWYPTTLALGNGNILTAMGNSTNVRNPDLWSGDSGWRVLNGIDFLDMRTRRNELGRENVFPLLSQAPDGSVYHFWDTEENHHLSTEGNGSSTVANPDTDHHDHAGGMQVMYDVGKLLISGSNDGSWGGNSSAVLADAFTVDLNGTRPVIRASGAMNFPRKFHQMMPLPTGEVLVVGGNTTGSKFQDDGSVLAAEIWNPATRAFRIVDAMTIPRDYHSTALLMVDGRIITAGGGYHPNDPSSGGTHQDAQIFSPPYLFNGSDEEATRPVVASDVSRVGHGEVVNVSTSGDIAFFSLIKMSATTHAINTDVRYFRPAFSNTGNDRYAITMHANQNVATPGYWMLFAVSSDGVPSIAEIIQVTNAPTDTGGGDTPVIEPISSTPQQTGSIASFNASASGSGVQYSWNFGDGSGDTPFSNQGSASHQYTAPGRYLVTVTAQSPGGDPATESFTQLVHHPLTAGQPTQSAALVEVPARNQLWNVNPDNNSVTVINTDSLARIAEVPVGINPRALAKAPDGKIWVTNKDSASVSVINPANRTIENTINLDAGSLPHGIVFGNNRAYVALEGTATVVQLDSTGGNELRRSFAGENPRHLSMNGARNELYVSAFITPALAGESGRNPQVNNQGGQVTRFATSANSLSIDRTILLAHSNREISEHTGPGLPNYLGPAVISPDGSSAWVPSKQDNILAGDFRGAGGMTFDQTVRAVTSRIDLASGIEVLPERVDHDNASVASHAAFDRYGLTLFVALEGNRQVASIDTTTAIEIARFDTGLAPQSLLLSDNADKLYVHNFMDRSISVIDVAGVVNQGDTETTELSSVNTVSSEKLAADVLRGKQLFYDARDDRLASLDYMSCASCHNEAGHDGRVWDFSSLGEGLRNTISLTGVAGTGDGLMHWSANFDEVQDFEAQIRDFAGGTGLMSDSDFFAGSRETPLGDRKAGISNELDALAAYLSSLQSVSPSPFRPGGELSSEAQTGKALFASKGCADCHAGNRFTDSGNTPNLHDIGTLDQDSGNRLSGALTGIDTPTLLNAWRTAPYLHDGSSATVLEAIQAHSAISVSTAEASALAEYVLQIDASESVASSIEIGGDPTRNAAQIDGWDSNLVINERDVFENTSGAAQSLDVTHFNFYVRRIGDPVTPFVARRNSNNNFTLLAVGTTRNNYQLGENRVAFNEGSMPSVTLQANETLVVGFLDAYANGSGGGTQSVIPFDYNGAEIWYSGGWLGSHSTQVSVGNAPQTGHRTLTNLRRDYRFSISLSVN